jgi:hypothetical protein
MKMTDRLAALLIVGVLAYCGFLFSEPLAAAVISRHWPEADAVIVSSEVQGHCAKSGGFSNRLIFRFQVNGTDYEAQRQNFGTSFCGSEEEADARARKYTPGAHVKIRYRSGDPADAVVSDSDVSNETKWTATIMFVVLGLCAWKLARQWREAS